MSVNTVGSDGCDGYKMRYNRHNDLVIIDDKVYTDFVGGEDNASDKLINQLCEKLNCKRLAVKSRITSDDFRTPNVRLVRGDNSWVKHKDNGIIYTFDVRKCMFSFGNIKEKLRVSRLDCTGETIVDLFAGIGYFTLVFAVHCNPQLIHCCEWNPNSITALEKNLELNRVSNKCIVHFGDNRDVCPESVADRVYMGLIPTSLESLEIACRALQKDSHKRILHIHENVSHFGCKTKSDIKIIWNNWAQELCAKISQIMSSIHLNTEWFVEVLDINKVKSYAPRIDHLVVDIKYN
ncbi:tRNA wybutosine-synthesizing protein 2 homolog [Oppia nitens]|uniref:tRNA wybutosine-synthesizing protein 2 homolog n=1 Tax=Oppia nitens TaxID=1686743 RepID=UPI0023DA240D|nr:tRNA wybutosine-synthesizing protein 2 homolog [Oppia nitens]